MIEVYVVNPTHVWCLHSCLFDMIKVQWMILRIWGILIVHYPSGHAVLVFYLPLFWTCYPGALKLQKEREVAKAEKEDRKREKKEKKREEKKAKKEKSNLGFGKATHESKGKYLFKCFEDEAEQLERSNLTEEHEPAVCSQNSSCSSDSTQNSNKRKRPASPSPSRGGIQAHGSIIRIRLSKKGVQGEISVSKEKHLPKPAQQVAEVTVRTSAERANPLLKTTNKGSCPPPVAVSEPSTSNCGWVDRVAEDNATPSCSKVHENSIEFHYKNLIENWLPPSLPSDNLDLEDDQSWLFQRKPKQARVEEKNLGGSDKTCGSCSSLWQQRAQYLPDVELYALPYTVPFWIT